MFLAVQYMIAKIWNQPKCPSTDDFSLQDKENVVHLYCEILATDKEILSLTAKWTQLELITLSEISQSPKTNTM